MSHCITVVLVVGTAAQGSPQTGIKRQTGGWAWLWAEFVTTSIDFLAHIKLN